MCKWFESKKKIKRKTFGADSGHPPTQKNLVIFSIFWNLSFPIVGPSYASQRQSTNNQTALIPSQQTSKRHLRSSASQIFHRHSICSYFGRLWQPLNLRIWDEQARLSTSLLPSTASLHPLILLLSGFMWYPLRPNFPKEFLRRVFFSPNLIIKTICSFCSCVFLHPSLSDPSISEIQTMCSGLCMSLMRPRP